MAKAASPRAVQAASSVRSTSARSAGGGGAPVEERSAAAAPSRSAAPLARPAGYAVIALASGVLVVALGLAVIMFGAAPISVLGTALAVGAAPPEKAGAAAATGQTAYDLGLALGIAVTGSVAVAVYRTGIPADAPAAAHESLGAALSLTDEHLIAQAREAFTTALHSASALSAAFALVTAVVVLALRGVPRT
ncbi:hypothetical protein ACI2LO_00910 [Streptomyces sp. NPDC033754]|uniref:hypothetical protein n=1 Tax=unclassified Streptomyces TaxID=2593676 RepID=UPI0033DB3CB3